MDGMRIDLLKSKTEEKKARKEVDCCWQKENLTFELVREIFEIEMDDTEI